MLKQDFSAEHLLQKTRSAFLWTRVLNIPFWSLLSLLTLILYKEMNINPMQIAIFVALKPMSALLAPYWSSFLHQRFKGLNSSLVWANILRYLPFLFLPWIDSPWLIIFAFGNYMMLLRGVVPAWMEIFKRNIKGIARERVFAFGTLLDYLGPALLPLAVGMLLDDYAGLWRWLFFGTALLGLVSTFFLIRIPEAMTVQDKVEAEGSFNLSHQLLKPWKEAWNLVKERPDFAKYQIGFMLGGSGLILMLSVQAMFFVDVLHLSYTEMAMAIALCKGIGVAMTSSLWVRLFRKIDIFYLSGIVIVLFALFPIILIGTQYHPLFLYIAFMLYGVAQAGSELSWHMSGPVFSNEGDSSGYSRMNVLAVGMRGCVAPFLGSVLYTFSNSGTVMLLGSIFCMCAAERFMRYSRTLKSFPQSQSECL